MTLQTDLRESKNTTHFVAACTFLDLADGAVFYDEYSGGIWYVRRHIRELSVAVLASYGLSICDFTCSYIVSRKRMMETQTQDKPKQQRSTHGPI